jgi:hypothetical protein
MEQEINSGHYFEIMDRCHVLMETIETHLLTHPAVDQENEERIQIALENLFDVYQWAGKKHLDMTEGE